jgi:hypothetical protein
MTEPRTAGPGAAGPRQLAERARAIGQAAAAAPEGFGDHGDPGESESGMWLRSAAALGAAQAGQVTLLPPTAVTLGELAGYRDVAGILARRAVIAPRLPRVVVEDGRIRLAMPEPGQERP